MLFIILYLFFLIICIKLNKSSIVCFNFHLNYNFHLRLTLNVTYETIAFILTQFS